MTPKRGRAKKGPRLPRRLFAWRFSGSQPHPGLLRARLGQTGRSKAALDQRSTERIGGGEAKKARAAHAKFRRSPIDPLYQALRQVNVHPLRGIGRRCTNNEIGNEVASLRKYDPLDRRGLR